MDKQKGPTGFIVVLPGEVIEIPQDSDKSWLTLFYSLPRELAEKLFFVKRFSLKKASEFPVFSKGFSLL